MATTVLDRPETDGKTADDCGCLPVAADSDVTEREAAEYATWF